jgi:hypothetical protein
MKLEIGYYPLGDRGQRVTLQATSLAELNTEVFQIVKREGFIAFAVAKLQLTTARRFGHAVCGL